MLEAHPEKTVQIVTGSSSYKNKVKKELKDSPLIFGYFTMEEKGSEKYLGQIIHSGGSGKEFSRKSTRKGGEDIGCNPID